MSVTYIKDNHLEERVEDYKRIAGAVNELTETNPFGALYLIGQLNEEERNPALYGIVLSRMGSGLDKMKGEDPQRFELAKDTATYQLFEKLNAYCASKLSEYQIENKSENTP